MLASAGGAFSSMLVAQRWFGKPDLGLMANGMLAGLVAITAPCAFVTSFGAVAIGVIAGVLLVASVYFVEHKLKVDDPVGAISVHGVNGAFGVLAVGLFADGSYGAGLNGVATPVIGLFYGGGFSQLIAQVIGAATCGIFIFASFFIFFKVADKVLGNRVSAEEELEGLDLGEVGVLAYPDFTLRPHVSLGSPEVGTVEPAIVEDIIPAKAQTSAA
jgi:Amt family ammonium transporter